VDQVRVSAWCPGGELSSPALSTGSMARWLVKEEPTHYSYADLARDGGTAWSGVHNPTALKNLRAMRPKDEVFYYHTGSEKSVVGIARVASVPRPDPEDDRGSWTVRIEPVRPLPHRVTLATIKADPTMAKFDLVRISRLSVMPVDAASWARILRYASSAASSAPGSRSSSRPAVGRRPGSA
jgi:predicted RNA-binding protein with PUA-like domain